MIRTRKQAMDAGPALTLGSIQKTDSEPPAKHVCKRHKWRTSKFYRECTRCRIVEEKDSNGNFALTK